MELNEPIEVYRTKNPNQAEIIRAALEAEGIACEITGEGQAGLVGMNLMEIAIVVRATDYDQAHSFIRSHLKTG